MAEADSLTGSVTCNASDEQVSIMAEAEAFAEHAKQQELCSQAYMNDVQQLGSLVRSCNVGKQLSIAEKQLIAFRLRATSRTQQSVGHLIKQCQHCLQLLKAHSEQQHSQYKELMVKEDAVREMKRQNTAHDELRSIFCVLQSYD